ncbi:MFS transporter [Cognatitamlana onchidii]|uniref:MFS transporter n=1 Tax=Cognatitamlana onchidii TaxID=2562860 RepID=UPI0010A5E000|nr:MFS transporter [Algibacter onchidii]
MKQSSKVLALIVFSQFCCTSLWFASNAVLEDLIQSFQLDFSALGHLTSAVQLGFIFGTLLFALFTVTDRFSPSKVFFFSALLGAFFNLGMILEDQNLFGLILCRFLTGFFLAGIYPVGMKIASDYYQEGLGSALGFLVGALVLGTAFPHIIKGSFSGVVPWRVMMVITSSMAVLGGFLIFALVDDGPFRKPLKGFDAGLWLRLFKNSKFRSVAFGYFGHMWELYAFWAFTPVLLETYASNKMDVSFNVPFWSFVIIGVGSLACLLSGKLSIKFSARRVAGVSLFLSCLCCLLSPVFFEIQSKSMFLMCIVFWGMVVIADSPLFSTLVAQNISQSKTGTALTIVNCTGFAITIISIQIISYLLNIVDNKNVFMVLAIGPILGLIALFKKRNEV